MTQIYRSMCDIPESAVAELVFCNKKPFGDISEIIAFVREHGELNSDSDSDSDVESFDGKFFNTGYEYRTKNFKFKAISMTLHPASGESRMGDELYVTDLLIEKRLKQLAREKEIASNTKKWVDLFSAIKNKNLDEVLTVLKEYKFPEKLKTSHDV